MVTQYRHDPNLKATSDLRVLYRNGIEEKAGGQPPSRQKPSSSSPESASDKQALSNTITPKNDVKQGKGTEERSKKPKILGGAYKDIEADGGERHHMPAKSVSTLSEDDGPAIWMEAADHAKTASNGNQGSDGKKYRARQAALIEQGRFDEALQMDIDDIRRKFGKKYDEGIKQMLEYYKTIPRWKLKLH